MRGIISIIALFITAITGLPSQMQHEATPAPQPTMNNMGTMQGMEAPFPSDELAPLVRGIYNGLEVWFIHTEASDPEVADLLTEMMGPQVIFVPSLAEIPEEILGNVYVFTNGVAGSGPMGFQPDVFDSIPTDETYTPLRAIHFVTWRDDVQPRMLVNAADIETAEQRDEVEIERFVAVVNMPILIWPDGHR